MRARGIHAVSWAMRAVLMVMVAAVLVGGCYRRVVGTRGLGATGVRVQPGYRADTAADRAVDGMMGRARPAESYEERRFDEPR